MNDMGLSEDMIDNIMGFYTKKRGQTILVSETYVNGKAKTVYTAANLEELVDNQ